MIVVVVGLGIGKQRGRDVVALHRRRSGAAPDRARVPELNHGSLGTESQLFIFTFLLFLIFFLLLFALVRGIGES